MNLEQFLLENAYAWPYGICSTETCVETVEFTSNTEGEPIIKENCPECGYKLEIASKLKLNEKWEDIPTEIRNKLQKEVEIK